MPDGKGDGSRDAALDATITASESDAATTTGAAAASVFDHYDVESEHARGGIGRVLRAWDTRLQRPVAIKELLAANDQHARRFLREIGITARLQHPSIVPVYEAGQAPNGSPFYAMRFVSGRTLRQLIDAAGSLADRMALLPNVLAVADAIAYAHSEGILHRDLKPSNVIIGSFGETIVIDWGLAKTLDETAADGAEMDSGPYRAPAPLDDRTVAGTVLGTPFYMPPEQAAGADVDARADVYALGAMLYHVLVGQPPYAGDSAPTQVTSVLAGAPAPLVSVQPNVPPDLVALVDKAMARAAGDRYPSAKEFAEDLRRYQTGQLVGAHRYSRAALLARWLRRHRTPVAVAALFTALLVAGGVASVRQIIRERNTAIAQRRIAQSRTNQMTLTQAASALESDPTATLAWLKTYPLDGENWAEAQRLAAAADARGVARLELQGQGQGKMRRVNSLVAGPGAREMTSVSDDGTVRIWDIDRGVETARATTGFSIGWSRYSPDHRWLITYGDGETRLFKVVSGRLDGGRILTPSLTFAVAFAADAHALLASDKGLLEVDLEKGATRRFEPLGMPVASVAYRNDGRIVTLGVDSKLRVWSPDGRIEATWEVPAHKPWQIFFDPSGRYAALTAVDKSFGVIDTTNGAYQASSGSIMSSLGGFLPDASAVVAVNAANAVTIWTLETNETRALQSHAGKVNAFAISKDGDYVASGDTKGEIVVTSLSRQTSVTLSAHKEVTSLDFVGDGLVAGYQDGTIRIWDAPLHLAGRARLAHWSNVFQILFSPDSRRLATGSGDRVVRLLSTAGDEPKRFTGTKGLVEGLAFSDDGKWLAAAADEELRIWDTQTEKTQQVLRIPSGVRRVRFLDEQHVVSGGEDGIVRSWDLATSQSKELSHHQGQIFPLMLDSSRQHVYSGGKDGAIHAWNFATNQESAWPLGLGPINQMDIAADQTSLATGTETGNIAILDLKTGAVRWHARHKRLISSLALSPTGKWLASGSEDGLVQLWDVVTGAPGLQFHHESMARALAFSRDGKWLASGGYDGVLRIFDMRTGATCAIHALDSHITRLAFSPDSATLALGAYDGTVHFWRSGDFAACAPSSPPALRDWMQQHTNLTISE